MKKNKPPASPAPNTKLRNLVESQISTLEAGKKQAHHGNVKEICSIMGQLMNHLQSENPELLKQIIQLYPPSKKRMKQIKELVKIITDAHS